MAKPLTVQRLRELIDSLREELKEIDDTLEAAQLCSQLNYGLYGDLSVASSSLGKAIEVLEFQLGELEDGGSLDEENIV